MSTKTKNNFFTSITLDKFDIIENRKKRGFLLYANSEWSMHRNHYESI